MRRAQRARSAAAFAILLVRSGTTAAHSSLAIGAFYAGALELVLHWQQALFILAGGIWCGQQTQPHQLWLGSCLVGGFMTGAASVWLGVPAPQALLVSAVGYTLIGIAVAACLQANWRWPFAVAVPAGMASGAGLAVNAIPTVVRPWLFLLGTLTGALLLLFYVSAAAVRLPAGWPRVALRVAGSWIAAIGLMVCAFSMQRPG